MFNKLFGRKSSAPESRIPSVLGLTVGTTFEIETLEISMLLNELSINNIDKTHSVQAVGFVQLDADTSIYRFYTNTEGWLQVVCQGGNDDSNVVDVKFFYYYDTLEVSNQSDWDNLLNSEIGQPTYRLDNTSFNRVWTASGNYHMPVHMAEKTYDESENFDQTDQFTMLFDRQVNDDFYEALFLSAEEKEENNGNLSRCLVISTGYTLGPAQLKLY